MLIQPVVLSGGSGTRLWPLSREKYPKQLLTLMGEDSLLQATLRRLEGLIGIQSAPPVVVCNEEYRFVVAEQLRLIGQQGRIVLEPEGRNTAPALTLAAMAAQSDGADPVLLVMPADHVVAQPILFQEGVCHAARLALEGAIVTFGITPDRPETGYGYIQAGATADEWGARTIARFVEKPDLITAESYLQAGDYLWNSGLFVLRASVWLKALALCRPDILSACEAAWQKGVSDPPFVRVAADAFAACPSDSIDYAVMERLPVRADLGIPACVLPLQAGWSDLGAWDALWDVSARDANNNATMGDAVLHDCTDSLLMANSRLVAGVGLHNIVVIETPDAVLVADKSQTQSVKHIVAQLKAQGHALANTHRKIHRPWGWYDSIDGGERFQVKRIVVNPGASLSLQMHHHRAEHWVVVKGTAEVTNGERTFLLGENESTYIPLGHVHRLANPGKVPLEIIEVQSGSYLGEDDIVRFQDNYGRTS